MRCCTTFALPRFAAQHCSTGKAAYCLARPDSSVSATTPPMGTFPCKGGGSNDYVYIFTSRANPEHWTRLLKVIGREDLIGDERYDTPWKRAEKPDEVNGMISDWTRQHSKHEAMEIIGAAGIPAGAVLDTMELSTDPTFELARHHAGDRPSGQRQVQNGCLADARFSGSPPPVKPAPLLGANNEDVLSHWLGMGSGDVGTLKASGVIG